MRLPLIPYILVALALILACRPAPSTAQTPEEVIQAAEQVGGVESLAVWRSGEMWLERYFKGGPKTRRHVRSVTKSVLSLLVGIAVDRGDLESIDLPIGELLPDVMSAYGADKQQITLRQLLTMSAGLSWDESTAEEYNRYRRAPDPLAHYLRRPRVAEAGGTFSYSSGASNLLARALERAIGVELPEFAHEHLFEPIGIEEVRWERLEDGTINGAAGLELRTEDMIRLGRLILQQGRWDNRQVVSAAWIDQATSSQIEAASGGHYGFQWWIEREPYAAAAAIGYGGQTIFIARELDLVVVATCRWTRLGAGGAERQFQRLQRFYREQLMPALTHDASEK